ncbi:hypothetical protein CAEBREN_07960 [Caenorhabditis brenneri]|uniref:Uncharacterized protein n=1 Tax=Caenorhabditis brenneri TaxID=135651 RepID=G0P4F2_CAEBE|nr:hypothetical protein CAEBREN_07960 [Caenorhabditis brenneri]
MSQSVPLSNVLDGINWRTHELRELNNHLAAAGEMKVRHVKGRYEKEGILQVPVKIKEALITLDFAFFTNDREVHEKSRNEYFGDLDFAQKFLPQRSPVFRSGTMPEHTIQQGVVSRSVQVLQ